jgi:hypothetical protein
LVIDAIEKLVKASVVLNFDDFIKRFSELRENLLTEAQPGRIKARYSAQSEASKVFLENLKEFVVNSTEVHGKKTCPELLFFLILTIISIFFYFQDLFKDVPEIKPISVAGWPGVTQETARAGLFLKMY